MTDAERPPPAPGGRPVVGHTLPFLRSPLSALSRWGRTDDPVVRARVAGRRVCLVTDPGAVERVLATDAGDYRKAEVVRDRLGRLQGGSLVLLEGEAWRERRELLGPAFGPAAVGAAGALTVRYATEAVEAWPTDRPVRAVEECRTLALSILARALFGLDLRGGETPIHEAADDVLARLDLRSPSAHLPEWVPTPRNRRFRRAVATLHDRIDAVVAGEAGGDVPRMGDGNEDGIAKGNEDGSAKGNEDGSENGNLLSILGSAGLDPETVRDELIALLFAGYDSTATALSLTLGLVGDHPEVAAGIRAELDAAVGDRTPTAGDLDDLPLLDAVVRESLRLYPPQYVLFREPVEAVELGGYRVEAGTTVVLPPWVLGRDPRYWAEPESFRPGRWLDGGVGSASGDGDAANGDGTGPAGNGATATGSGPATGEDRPAFAYFPYGGGPRHCLGATMADRTIRLVLAVVCSKRRLELEGSLSVSAGPTLSPDPIPLRARRID